MKFVILLLIGYVGYSHAQLNEFGSNPIFSDVDRVSLSVIDMVDDNCAEGGYWINSFMQNELERNRFRVTNYSRHMPKVKVVLKGYALTGDYKQCVIMIKISLMDELEYIKSGKRYKTYVNFDVVSGVLSGNRDFIQPALQDELARGVRYLYFKRQEAQ